MKIIQFEVLKPITRQGRKLAVGVIFSVKKSSSRVHVDRWIAEGRVKELADEPAEFSVAANDDSALLDWMEVMRRNCEGHVLTRCFLPGESTLRENIRAMRKLNP